LHQVRKILNEMECGGRVAGIIRSYSIGWTGADIVAAIVNSTTFGVQYGHVIFAARLQHSQAVDVGDALGCTVAPSIRSARAAISIASALPNVVEEIWMNR
jgi:hypothetical protein